MSCICNIGLDDILSTDTLVNGLIGAAPGLLTGNPALAVAGGVAGGYKGASSHDAKQGLQAANQRSQEAIGQAREDLNRLRHEQYRQRMLDLNKALSMFDPTNQLYHQMHGGPMHGGRMDVPAPWADPVPAAAAAPAPAPAPPPDYGKSRVQAGRTTLSGQMLDANGGGMKPDPSTTYINGQPLGDTRPNPQTTYINGQPKDPVAYADQLFGQPADKKKKGLGA